MNTFNFRSIVLAILLGIGAGTLLHAQQEAPEPDKKVIIIKKMTDENGNTIVEKIVKEGEAAEDFQFESIEGEGDVRIYITKDKEGDNDNDVHILSDEDILEVRDIGGLDEEFEIEIENQFQDLEAKDQEGLRKYKFKIQKDGEDPEVIEWEGDGEMPAKILEQLEKAKFKTDGLSPAQHNFMRGFKPNGNGAFLGVVMKDKIEVEDGVEHREGFSEDGAYISEVRSGSAAEKAGLKAGDVITDIDGEPVTSFEDLTQIIAKHQPGDQINIAFLRDGNVQTVDAVLGKRQGKSAQFGSWNHNKNFTVTKELPCLLIGVYTETAKSNPESKGVRVTSIIEDTPAKDIQMQAGDVIVALNGTEINDHKTLTVERDKHAPGDKVSIVYLRDGQEIADEITFRSCEEAKKSYIIRRGKNTPAFKTKKHIIIIKKPKDEIVEVAPEEGIETPPLGISNQQLQLDAFRAFPNPSQGVITLRFEGAAQPTVIRVTDISGREIYREQLDDFPGWYSNRIDLSDAAPGTLLVNIDQAGKTFSEKIVITDANRP